MTHRRCDPAVPRGGRALRQLCWAGGIQAGRSPARLQALLHPDAHEEGGLGFTDRELLERQRGCELGLRCDCLHCKCVSHCQPAPKHLQLLRCAGRWWRW